MDIKQKMRREIKMINQRVILVTDSNPQIINADISRRDLEGNSTLATKKIIEALQSPP